MVSRKHSLEIHTPVSAKNSLKKTCILYTLISTKLSAGSPAGISLQIIQEQKNGVSFFQKIPGKKTVTC